MLTTTVDCSFGHDELTQVSRTYNGSGTVTGAGNYTNNASVTLTALTVVTLNQLFWKRLYRIALSRYPAAV